MSKKALADYELMLPEDLSQLRKLDDTITPLYMQIVNNIEENRRLAALRGALLPRLMSGEIDVSEVELPSVGSRVA